MLIPNYSPKLILALITTLLFYGQELTAQKSSSDFVTTWKTDNEGTTGDSTITINTSSRNSYNYDIDWNNDGFFDDLNVTGNLSHTYPTTGTYTIRIRGVFPEIKFGVLSDNRNKLISIDQWGSIPWETMYRSFEQCNELSEYNATDNPDLTVATSLRNMFYSANKFNGDISHWNVSNIKDMSNIFGDCNLFNQDLSEWNVSQVEDFSNMFYYCESYDQDLSKWTVSSAKKMTGMFRNSKLFNGNISNWDVSSVESFANMFMYTDSFNIDITNWDVSSAKDMTYMFRSSISFNQDISSWDVDSVTQMQGTFDRATNFNQDISTWDVSRVTNMWWMFNEASSFNQDISNWEVGNVKNMYGMFDEAVSFNQNLGPWDIKSVTDMRHMFAYSGLSTVNYDNTLISWQSKTHQPNVEFYPYDKTYCISENARELLINDGWVFSNGDSKNCTVTQINRDHEDYHFNIYPNPSNGNITVSNIDLDITDQLVIYNSFGQVIEAILLNKTTQSINLSHLPEGTYLLKHNNKTEILILN